MLAVLPRLGFPAVAVTPPARVTVGHCQWVLPAPMLPSLGEVSSQDLERGELGGADGALVEGAPLSPGLSQAWRGPTIRNAKK